SRDSPFEEDLRLLLERTAPRLPAPEQWMRQIRKRVVRRRRLRAAGAVAGVVAAASLTALLRSPVGPSGTDHPPPAATTSPPSLSPPPPSTPAPTPSSSLGGRIFRSPGFPGLAIRLPEGWHSMVEPKDSTIGYAATLPMSAGTAMGLGDGDGLI